MLMRILNNIWVVIHGAIILSQHLKSFLFSLTLVHVGADTVNMVYCYSLPLDLLLTAVQCLQSLIYSADCGRS